MWEHTLFTYLRLSPINYLTQLSSHCLYKINTLMNNVQNDIKTLFKRYIVAWENSLFCI